MEGARVFLRVGPKMLTVKPVFYYEQSRYFGNLSVMDSTGVPIGQVYLLALKTKQTMGVGAGGPRPPPPPL